MKKNRHLLYIFLLPVFLTGLLQIQAQAMDNQAPGAGGVVISGEKMKAIEKYIAKRVKEKKLAGVSVVIVNGDNPVFYKGYGYADLKTKRAITPFTLYEIGSCSKAFTGFAILYLANKGLVNMDDKISKYIPWFKVMYEGEEQEIALYQLLHHTSGLPESTLGDIPSLEGDNAIEETARKFIGVELVDKPGKRIEYASLNYDLLALVVSLVSGQTFEAFMKESIFKPLGLNNTYLFRDEAVQHDMSTPYKFRFFVKQPFLAPLYRGNTPAGYVITCAEDAARWLKIQMGMIDDIPEEFKQVVIDSHVPDRTVEPTYEKGLGGASYAAGWAFFQKGAGGELLHRGGNPNYAAFMIFRPNEKVGVAMMANNHTEIAAEMTQNVMDMIMDRDASVNAGDLWQSYDQVASSILIVLIPFSLALVVLIFMSLAGIIAGKKKFTGFSLLRLSVFTGSLGFIALYCYCINWLPNLMLLGYKINFLLIWLPETIIIAMYTVLAAGVLLYIYMVLTFFFKSGNESPIFSLVSLSVVSGLGNAMLIFVINRAISSNFFAVNSPDNTLLTKHLVLYFIVGLVVYIAGQRLIRTNFIKITNQIIYDIRMKLIKNLLNISFEKLEKIELGKIQACLNNDTEVISGIINLVVTGATSAVTLIFCFLYIGLINIYGLLASVAILCIAACMYFIVGKSANKLLEATRTIQNIFFKFINDLVGGFKELSIRKARREEFGNEIRETCVNYREKRKKSDLKFSNVFITGEILFITVIGIVVFLLPLLFDDINNETLTNYVFVFLYMAGPVRVILDVIPNLMKMRISWSRVKQMENDLVVLENKEAQENAVQPGSSIAKLELKDINYQYKNEDNENFALHSINCTFRGGEIVFITGGNGSGKTTLTKVIMGLYTPDNGDIIIDGRVVNTQSRSEFFSAVFSDFYLFEKLYGIDYSNRDKDIHECLETLKISDKVRVNNGVFSTLKLSTGQRKRLALMLAFLENNPVCVFDEWATEQDAEFRDYFYKVLLPMFRKKGRLIIAITHDDRYFHAADRLIKMDMGKIVEVIEKPATGSGPTEQEAVISA